MADPTFEELHNLGTAETVLRRPDLAVREGDVSDMFIAAAAAMGDRLVGYTADRISATFLDTARAADLTKLAADHWGIERNAAAKASATVTVTRSGADATAQTLPIGTVFATARDSTGNEIRYVSTTEASWAASTNGARTVSVQAETAGVAGNLAAINLITRMLSTAPAGGTYTVTSSTQPAGGADEEDDATLRDRVRAYPSTLRRGTLKALEYGALQVSGVAKSSAVQDSTGLVNVYVTDASGASSGASTTVGPLVVDDGTMTKKVAIELFDWACAGALVVVVGGTLQTIDITVDITVRAGVDVDDLIADIQAAIEAAVNRLRIGETLYKSLISAAARNVDPDNILEVSVTAPAVDTAPSTSGHIIRAGTITVE
jgi:uncharacterized phage protein gp47/JayE